MRQQGIGAHGPLGPPTGAGGWRLQILVGASRVHSLTTHPLPRALQDAALHTLASSSGAGGASQSAGTALERMGDELYYLMEEDSQDSPHCAHFLSSLSRQAAAWAAAGQQGQARRCLERAMRHSLALEAEVAGQGPCERQEEKVVSLFSLYLEGAKAAADNKQQVQWVGGGRAPAGVALLEWTDGRCQGGGGGCRQKSWIQPVHCKGREAFTWEGAADTCRAAPTCAAHGKARH